MTLSLTGIPKAKCDHNRTARNSLVPPKLVPIPLYKVCFVPSSPSTVQMVRNGAQHKASLRFALAQALSSFFSSFRKRQSVPCAMSVLGLVLIIPTSCRRRA